LELIMKATQLFVLPVLAFALQGVTQAAPYPSDAEASYNLAALETYADQQSGLGEGAAVWGVTKREARPHDAFPFGGGYIDD
jgi:hypothetical protein